MFIRWYSTVVTANASSMDHKITKIHHFVALIVLTFECYIQHSNVATFKGLFECRTFIYALIQIKALKDIEGL